MVSASASRDAAPARALPYRPISAGPAEIEVLLVPSDVRDRPRLTDTRLACVLGPFSKIPNSQEKTSAPTRPKDFGRAVASHLSGAGDGSAARCMGVSELWTRGAPLFPDGGTLDAGGGVTGRSNGDHRTGGGGGHSEVGNGGSVLSDAKAPRPRWGSTSEFILAAVGSAVGLGNLLRFPHMVYKHGGLAFLVPYALAVIFLGVPVLAMELALGQVAQAGCVDALAAMHGRAWGIGCAATLAAFLLASYYCAVLAWAWCFLVATWSKVLPWSDGRCVYFYICVWAI